MRVLLIGSGSREHAIAWKLVQSSLVSRLFTAPGNAGTSGIGENVPINVLDIPALLEFASQVSIDLVVVGPEAPLAAGMVDIFQANGLSIFGPTQSAAQIETSKWYAKQMMIQNQIPTGGASTFTDINQARDYLACMPVPVAIKADGLAGGKGVVVARTRNEAVGVLHQFMTEKTLGNAGARVVIEEYLEGPEISVFAFVNGGHVSAAIAACDYKRVGDGDVGPNTGGMGSFSPPVFWTKRMEERIRNKILIPMAGAMCNAGTPYTGVLYAGLMLTEEGPKVIEFNCRLGDPETQVILPLLQSDLCELMLCASQNSLASLEVRWSDMACTGVVLASKGYPGDYSTGFRVEGLDAVDGDVLVFHGGTSMRLCGESQGIVSDGGRVLTVVARDKCLSLARDRVYDNIKRINFQGSFYRRDIASMDYSMTAG